MVNVWSRWAAAIVDPWFADDVLEAI